MANLTAKTSSNIFYKARCEAATHNEQLSSREGAADYMSIDRGRLYRIESGIAGVIFQDGQFSPISNGRYDEVKPDADCYRALQLIQIDGWDESRGATYFESKSESNWHSEHLTFLFQHGKHYFYKE